MQIWLEPLLKTALVVLVLQGAVAYLVLVERKVAAYIQDRLGPNRVGPWGLLQPLADGAKFILKEEIIPAGADKVLFLIA
ncbi:MAG TPA: NADH-quinone oxidoreductase subunit H, partial [Planctomycetaceae bacterium]